MDRRHRLSSAVFSMLVLLFADGVCAGPIEGNPVFASLVGQWEGEGELVDAADGSVTSVKEAWKGEFTGGGNFTVSGKRLFDQNEHEFTWDFFANGDLIEGQMTMSNPEVDLRFEAVVSEADRKIVIKVPLTGGGGVLTIVNTVSEDGTTIEGTVERVDDAGQTATTGKVVHKKG